MENLLGETELPLSEQLMIRHQFHQARLELDQWVRLAVAVLAHTTRKAALATPPRRREPSFKSPGAGQPARHAWCCWCWCCRAGRSSSRCWSLEEPVEQEVLSRLSNQFNDRFRELAASEIIGCSCPALAALGQQVGGIVVQMMASVDQPDQ